MGAAEMQKALARLLADETLRQQFYADPNAVGRRLGFGDEEIRRLSELSPRELKTFAASLYERWLMQTSKLMPLTTRALGERFRAEFRKYADTHLPGGAKRLMQDALDFNLYLGKALRASGEPRWLLDLVRYERARIKASDPRRRLVVCVFRHDIGRLVRSIARKETTDALPRPCAAFWMRFRRGQSIRYAVILMPRLRK